MLLKLSLILIFTFVCGVYAHAQTPYIGEIRMFSRFAVPSYWMRCEGQLLQISEYSTLFAIIGTTYGGDGVSTFALPDLRGRTPIGQGAAAGLTTRTIRQSFGTENSTISVANLPPHNHPILVNSNAGNSASPFGNYLAHSGNLDPEYRTDANNFLHSGVLTSAGNGNAITNMQPYTTINFMIAVEGVFPPNN